MYVVSSAFVELIYHTEEYQVVKDYSIFSITRHSPSLSMACKGFVIGVGCNR